MAEAKIAGGAYLVGGQFVNANGEPLSDEQIEAADPKAAKEIAKAKKAKADAEKTKTEGE
jgi:hypothetical protein